MNEKDKFPAQWEAINMAFENGKQQAKKEFLEIIDKYKKYQKESEYEFEDIVVSVEMLKKEVEKISNKTRDIAGYMGGSIAGACRNKEK